MASDNLVPFPGGMARELSQLEAVTMALDSAQDRGRAGDPQAFLDGLPWGWAVVNTNAVGQLAGTLMDALAGGLDGDDDVSCAECGQVQTPGEPGELHKPSCVVFDPA